MGKPKHQRLEGGKFGRRATPIFRLAPCRLEVLGQGASRLLIRDVSLLPGFVYELVCFVCVSVCLLVGLFVCSFVRLFVRLFV